MHFPTTTFQVLEIADGSSDPQWNLARENALINLAGIASDTGDKDAAVAAYQTILRQVLGKRALLKSKRLTKGRHEHLLFFFVCDGHLIEPFYVYWVPTTRS